MDRAKEMCRKKLYDNERLMPNNNSVVLVFLDRNLCKLESSAFRFDVREEIYMRAVCEDLLLIELHKTVSAGRRGVFSA